MALTYTKIELSNSSAGELDSGQCVMRRDFDVREQGYSKRHILSNELVRSQGEYLQVWNSLGKDRVFHNKAGCKRVLAELTAEIERATRSVVENVLYQIRCSSEDSK